MRKSVTNEKPLAPAGTEAKGDKAVKPVDVEDNLFKTVCPAPATPEGSYRTTEIKAGGSSLSVHFRDWNDKGLRSEPSGMRFSINTDFDDNVSNKILACLTFFKWNGKEYAPCSLIEDHSDLAYIVLGNITEFESDPSEDERLGQFIDSLGKGEPVIFNGELYTKRAEKEVSE